MAPVACLESGSEAVPGRPNAARSLSYGMDKVINDYLDDFTWQT